MVRRLWSVAILAWLLSGCASLGGARHVAVVSVVSVDAVLSAAQDGEMLLSCGKPLAPAPPACVPADVHRRISALFVTAFDLEGQVAKLVRAVPVGGMLPADVPSLLGQIGALLDRVFKLIPTSPQKQHLVAKIGGAQ